ncbi:MAG: V-type ATP synthase subunit A [Candidatus Peribacteraceae bacterium]|jgi:V/A-type H+-transporting ATPase subunit A|nr:V-type ATP synthase subunit A [Candidatus Peribacteraceae bacterium]MDP7454561.1 V-type ATP synthase subunit A [Candidatus Peribacteraceae bacterium]
MSTQPTIVKVVGPLVVAKGMKHAKMYEVVRVSKEKLVGEVIELHGDEGSIQVYEETAGVGPGEPVELTGATLSVELAPGLLEQFYDGIQRPLKLIEEKAKSQYITRGIEAPGLDRDRKWDFEAVASSGDEVEEGDILGTVQETTLIEHKVMVPPGKGGTLKDIKSGSFTIEDTVATIKVDGKDEDIIMLQKWPIRVPRPTGRKLLPTEPLATGMRVLDTLFPIARGGAGAIPGPFGAGKTVTQQSLAKFADAQVIVYIGCGERGNEMTDVLKEFPELEDPNTGEPLMKRTVLIANTSNMPVAAREASVYTGITIAEYYRDMGYDVALMADSTSRWAEAMREMSGRLQEMPGEEGYPAYLGSRTAGFYERTGACECLGSDERRGSLTAIGAVSPQGGDFSEPVTQNTLRVTKVFWALDAKLTYKRHFPSINWLQSYSLYTEALENFYSKEIAEDFSKNRTRTSEILQQESKLEEIVRLVGTEALSHKEQLTLDVAKMIREDFLFQNALDPVDAYTSIKKQYRMMRAILLFMDSALPVIDQEDFDFSRIQKLSVKEDITKCSFIPEESMEAEFDKIEDKIRSQVAGLKDSGTEVKTEIKEEAPLAA